MLLDAETTIYCDDDGLCDGLIASTQIEGYGNALAGKLVIVGLDGEGNSTGPKQTADEITAKLVVLRPVMDPVFEQPTRPDVFGCKLTGFTLRLQRDRYKPSLSEC